MTTRLALVLLAGCASAPPAPKPTPAPIATGRIQGSVHLADVAWVETGVRDVPLPDVTIIARADATGELTRATTDTDGHYKLALVPGTYKVRGDYEGQVVLRRDVLVTSARSTPVFFEFLTNSLSPPGRPHFTAR